MGRCTLTEAYPCDILTLEVRFMPGTKIRLEQIEEGRILKQLVLWFRSAPRSFPTRLNALRIRSRAAARRAGITLKDVDRLIAEVRSRRAKA